MPMPWLLKALRYGVDSRKSLVLPPCPHTGGPERMGTLAAKTVVKLLEQRQTLTDAPAMQREFVAEDDSSLAEIWSLLRPLKRFAFLTNDESYTLVLGSTGV